MLSTEGPATADGDAEVTPDAGEEDDGVTVAGASGVQAARTVSPAPAARKRAKERRLAPSGRLPRSRGTCVLNLPQEHAADGVVRVLGQNQLGAARVGRTFSSRFGSLMRFQMSLAVRSASAGDSVAYRWK
ncbi:hypothetical protein AHiyo4_35890 [Arthrobacter sp. Hiyo4]|nr:hypothetical protein AHiyo4_35890 [Arthrobacter sp. Hiyo4]